QERAREQVVDRNVGQRLTPQASLAVTSRPSMRYPVRASLAAPAVFWPTGIGAMMMPAAGRDPGGDRRRRGPSAPRPSPSNARWLAVRGAVNAACLLGERRESLTLAQIQRTKKLLADRAEELYRRANRVERGTVAPRLPKALSLAARWRREAGTRDQPGATAA